MLTLRKISETSTSITLGWDPPVGVGGYVVYSAAGTPNEIIATHSKNLKDGTPYAETKFSKTQPGPPYEVAAVVRGSDGALHLESDVYPDAAPPSEWTTVAQENATFTLTENREVRYGVDPQWNSKILGPGTYTCNNATFGDPSVGAKKHCEARPTDQTPPPEPLPSNVARSAPTGVVSA